MGALITEAMRGLQEESDLFLHEEEDLSLQEVLDRCLQGHETEDPCLREVGDRFLLVACLQEVENHLRNLQEVKLIEIDLALGEMTAKDLILSKSLLKNSSELLFIFTLCNSIM